MALLEAAGLSLLSELSASPCSALAQRRAVRAGLSTQPWEAWLGDLLKSTAMTAGFSAGAALALVKLTRRYQSWWWLVAAAMGTAGQTALTFLAPVILDPVFNRFDLLEPGPVREDVFDLSRRAGVDVGEVYRVDASRRTRAANAYVTGLGSTRRVVLFDTLLDSFSREQIRLVVAHELAHVRNRDLLRSLTQQALNAPASMYATSRLAARIDPGVEDQPSTTNLAALVISLALIGAITGPCAASLSRQIEARADAFALALTGSPEQFIAFQQQIVKQNLEDPQPPRWLRMARTHPATVERIGTARAYARDIRQL
ncbi:MAG TPA: M48 family metalloprotease [Solirubrobacteraceae bacterium]